MIMWKALPIAATLAVGSASHAFAQNDACETDKPIVVHVISDGSIVWETTPVSNAEAIRRFSEAAKRKPVPSVRVVPDRKASYESVARVLSDAVEAKFYCIGFTGVDTGK